MDEQQPSPEALKAQVGDAIYDLNRLRARHDWDEDTFDLMRLKAEAVLKALDQLQATNRATE